MQTKSKWVDTKTAREHFSLPKSTFEWWYKKGMPVLKFRKARRFNLEELEKWFREQHDRQVHKDTK